ncbi:MAG: hypothetical protein K6T83_15880 [Alicyclobacillus sp.]|nr:hypothetical protein [Alicyclobacillus sp.]
MDKAHFARSVVEYLSQNGVTARLMGGLGIYHQCPRLRELGLTRKYEDVDLVGLSQESRELKNALELFGFVPDRRFNAVHGERRLLFHYEGDDESVDLDVFLDVFEMCHVIRLKDRLHIDKLTLSLADLLLTKLQVVQFTRKDASDTLALLAHHQITDSDAGINAYYIGRLVSDDWGLYTTIRDNLLTLTEMMNDFDIPQADRSVILERVKALINKIHSQSKTIKWKIRSKIGRKMQWYELPDEKRL